MPRSTEAENWAIDYEECGLDELWVYKFDHEPLADGEWRKLNAESDANYRLVKNRIQMIAPCDQTGDEQFQCAFEGLRGIAPLYSDGTLEIVIRCDSKGLRVSERNGTMAARANDVSSESLRAAYDELSQMPNRWA